MEHPFQEAFGTLPVVPLRSVGKQLRGSSSRDTCCAGTAPGRPVHGCGADNPPGTHFMTTCSSRYAARGPRRAALKRPVPFTEADAVPHGTPGSTPRHGLAGRPHGTWDIHFTLRPAGLCGRAVLRSKALGDGGLTTRRIPEEGFGPRRGALVQRLNFPGERGRWSVRRAASLRELPGIRSPLSALPPVCAGCSLRTCAVQSAGPDQQVEYWLGNDGAQLKAPRRNCTRPCC